MPNVVERRCEPRLDPAADRVQPPAVLVGMVLEREREVREIDLLWSQHCHPMLAVQSFFRTGTEKW
jgi:hypothetical protein